MFFFEVLFLLCIMVLASTWGWPLAIVAGALLLFNAYLQGLNN